MKTRIVSIVLLIAFLGSASAVSAPLVWEDSETRQVLFTSDDIVAFDWEKQVFLLRIDAYLDFLAWVPPHRQLSKKLAVRDNEGIIYEAYWVSPVCSWTFSGAIYDTFDTNPFIRIENGYPTSQFSDSDSRFANRLKSGLENAGRLRSFDPQTDYANYRLRDQRDAWIDCGEDMKIRIECYENTFQAGRKARAHIFFANSTNPTAQIDGVEAILRLGNPNGAGETEPVTFNISPEDIKKGIFVCEFDPWSPSIGSYSVPREGVCAVRFTFSLLQKNGDSVTTLATENYPEMKVTLQSSIESGMRKQEWTNQ